jgi:hypothetical protein
MDSIEQIHAMKGYFDMIVREQVLLSNMKGSYEQSAFARLMLKSLNDSYVTLRTQVPFEITARYLAAYMEVSNSTCTTYLTLAIPDAP